MIALKYVKVMVIKSSENGVNIYGVKSVMMICSPDEAEYVEELINDSFEKKSLELPADKYMIAKGLTESLKIKSMLELE